MSDSRQIPGQTLYELIGGERTLRDLVDRFFDILDVENAYPAVRKLYPEALDGPRKRLFWFLSGWLGGPPIYADKIGPPMLRARHVPYSIGVDERDQWLTCMSQAMDEAGIAPAIKPALANALFTMADWLRNRPEK